MATAHRAGKDEPQSIAHEAMLERGLLPDFSRAVITETNQITRAAIHNLPRAAGWFAGKAGCRSASRMKGALQ